MSIDIKKIYISGFKKEKYLINRGNVFNQKNMIIFVVDLKEDKLFKNNSDNQLKNYV